MKDVEGINNIFLESGSELESIANEPPFYRMKVKLKKEIVSKRLNINS